MQRQHKVFLILFQYNMRRFLNKFSMFYLCLSMMLSLHGKLTYLFYTTELFNIVKLSSRGQNITCYNIFHELKCLLMQIIEYSFNGSGERNFWFVLHLFVHLFFVIC